MSTFFPSREQALKDRKWVVVDAAGQPLGRVASQVAAILRGKNKVTFSPHVDTGDFVVVINAAKIALTGNKLQNKIYYHHTEFIGSLKAIPAGEMLAKSPEKVIRRAVKGMLPSGPLGFSLINKLKVFDGPQHTHSAQQPQPVALHN